MLFILWLALIVGEVQEPAPTQPLSAQKLIAPYALTPMEAIGKTYDAVAAFRANDAVVEYDEDIEFPEFLEYDAVIDSDDQDEEIVVAANVA